MLHQRPVSISFRTRFKKLSLLIVSVFILSSVIASGVITPLSQTNALVKTAGLEPSRMASSFAYFKALRTCLDKKSWKNSISLAVGAGTAVGTVGPASFSQADATSLEWFNVRRWVGGVPGGAAGLFGATEVNAVNIGAFNDPRGTTGDGSQNCGGDEGKAWIGLALGLWDYDAPKFLCNQLGFSLFIWNKFLQSVSAKTVA